MSKIFIPTKGPEDWKSLLADPDKHWKTGNSARALAFCWEEAKGFPKSVKIAFKRSEIKLFEDPIMLFAFPEYKVPLPGSGRASQNDIFVLAKGNNELISIAVEGKVSEPFGPTIEEWKTQDLGSGGKQRRLDFLINKLALTNNPRLEKIRYQLLHRTASAIIMAETLLAKNALMLVHSFSQSNEWFEDYRDFLGLYSLVAQLNTVQGPIKVLNNINLYFGWVKGEGIYLTR